MSSLEPFMVMNLSCKTKLASDSDRKTSRHSETEAVGQIGSDTFLKNEYKLTKVDT